MASASGVSRTAGAAPARRDRGGFHPTKLPRRPARRHVRERHHARWPAVTVGGSSSDACGRKIFPGSCAARPTRTLPLGHEHLDRRAAESHVEDRADRAHGHATRLDHERPRRIFHHGKLRLAPVSRTRRSVAV